MRKKPYVFHQCRKNFTDSGHLKTEMFVKAEYTPCEKNECLGRGAKKYQTEQRGGFGPSVNYYAECWYFYVALQKKSV